MESRLTSWSPESLDSCVGDHEVYVAARPFTAFGGDFMQRLSPEAKSLLVDAGICHYMFILRDPRGKLTMFDFGPIGGDVHVGVPAGAAPSSADKSRTGGKASRSVDGEIRVTQLETLPSTCMLLGLTNLAVNDVKRINTQCKRTYELNVNDCRHYVNDLVLAATGKPNAAARLVRHQFLQRRSHELQLHDLVFPALQVLTNSDNWCVVQRSAHAVGVAALLTVSSPLIAPPVASCSTIALAALSSLSSAAQRVAGAAAVRVAHHKKILVSSATAAAASSSLTERHPQSAPVQLLRQMQSGHGAVLGAVAGATRSLAAFTDAAKAKLTQRFASARVLARHRLPRSASAPVLSVTACAQANLLPASAALQRRPVAAAAAAAPPRHPLRRVATVPHLGRAPARGLTHSASASNLRCARPAPVGVRVGSHAAARGSSMESLKAESPRRQPLRRGAQLAPEICATVR